MNSLSFKHKNKTWILSTFAGKFVQKDHFECAVSTGSLLSIYSLSDDGITTLYTQRVTYSIQSLRSILLPGKCKDMAKCNGSMLRASSDTLFV